MKKVARNIPSVEVHDLKWSQFQDFFGQDHRQGEHVAIVGPTGSGKSVLALELCKLRAKRKQKNGRPASVIVLATKPKDRTISALGWPTLREWPPGYGQEHAVVWPRPRDPETRARGQRKVFRHVLTEMYAEGGHTVCIDEAAYFEQAPPNGLGLGATLDEYWRSARGLDLTLIAATQRPRNVSVSMWSEPVWLITFRVDDFNDVKRVAEISGDREALYSLNDNLSRHQFACVYRPRAGQRHIIRSVVEL